MYIPASFNEAIAHIIDKDGNKFQALNESSDDWDETATQQQMKDFYDGKLT